MISGLWGNSNFDDEKNTRQKALSEIENSYQEVVLNVYNKERLEEIEFKNDPFFAAMKLPDENLGEEQNG
jgi:phosphosulfolactate phosphohydrolase-like enzyme